MFKKIKRKFKGEGKTVNSSEWDYLIKNLNDAKKEMSELNKSIDYATDPILLNQLIFQLKATEMRYRYWYKLAKETYEKKVII